MTAIVVVAAGLAAGAAGCSSASYDERRAYLDKTAQRGVEAHQRMAAQGGQIDEKRCRRAFFALALDDLPGVDVGSHGDWQREVEQTFIDSCRSGTAASASPSTLVAPTA
ncbi:hypothetical protein [Micromonospora sp. NPDC047730]|uniref:hypothetical protein n=1 Tax=Micromonospora sp. NPDC047730 TaxID=3364253 RepID=UPI0037134E78